MSQLIYCPIMTTKQPYHLENVDLNVFSIEELMYFYKKNIILIDQSIMQPEFISWVRQALGQERLAEKLHQLVAGGASLKMFFEALLKQINTFEEDEKAEFLNHVLTIENKTEVERRKVMADQMLERGRYEAAILEYRRIIEGNEHVQGNEQLLAKVWHNLGYCYGQLLLYKQAMECFQKAYSYQPFSETQDSVRALQKAIDCVEEAKDVEENSYVDLLEFTDNEKRLQRYQQLKDRKQEYIRSMM